MYSATMNFTNFSENVLSSNESLNSSSTLLPSCYIHLRPADLIRGICMITGAVANALVFIVICVNKKLHSTTYAVIAGLALCDTLFTFHSAVFSIVVLPFLDKTDFRSEIICVPFALHYYATEIGVHIMDAAFLASSGHVAFLAVIRYVILVHPLTSHLILRKREIAVTFSVIWIYSSGIIIGLAMRGDIILNTIHWVFSYFAPLFVTIIFHVIKFIKLRRSQFSNASKQIRSMGIIITGIILLFVILPLPWNLLRLLYLLDMADPSYDVWNYTGILLQINNCINPFFYAIMSKQVRRGMTRPCKACRLRHRQTSGSRSRGVSSPSYTVTTVV